MSERVEVLQRVASPTVAYRDREAAGLALADALVTATDPSAVVLALPRGGIPVAAPVARALHCELRPVAVRKLPLPESPEMGFGAVTLDGTATLNHAVMRMHGVGMGQAAIIIEKVREEVRRRAEAYPGAEELPLVTGRTVYVVDDGLATGYTMIATCEMVRHHEPSQLVVAVPTAPSATIDLVAQHCDRLLSLIAQESGGFAVASFYASFPDLTDDEVRGVLAAQAHV